MEKLEQLQAWINESQRMVFFGGAGVSTESGIPDFRSVDGLYHQHYDFPPEEIISHHFFMEHPAEFYRFYKEKMMALSARPNLAHQKLAQWEERGKLLGVITQNIDGLHQAAGSRRVLELHGSIHRNFCMACGKGYTAAYVKESVGIPRCSCGGMIKPDVVLYEESLDEGTLSQSISLISQADLLIVGGTSLAVYPAAGLLRYFQGAHLVVINRSPTPVDSRADLLLSGRIGEVLGALG